MISVTDAGLKPTCTLHRRLTTTAIIIHRSNCTEEDIETMHKKHIGNGWYAVGYHFIIYKNGDVYRGRDIHSAGFHCIGKNSSSIGILIYKSPEAEASLTELLTHVTSMYPDAEILHKEIKNEYKRISYKSVAVANGK